jgi:hypothetical protein
MYTDKKKKRKPLKLNPEELEGLVDELVGDGLPEGVFGVLDNHLDRAQKEADDAAVQALRKPKKIEPRRPRVLPNMQIQTPRMPEEGEGLDVANVVSVPESLLRKIARGVDHNTAQVNALLLETLIPLMLSYETGTSYARAAMRDGLNIEMDFDQGLGEAIKHIGYLNVIFFYIKKSKLPKSLKQRFMRTFSDALANQSMTTLIETNKLQAKQTLQQELQAVVYSGQQRKTTVHTVDDKKTDKPGSRNDSMPVAVKRRSAR